MTRVRPAAVLPAVLVACLAAGACTADGSPPAEAGGGPEGTATPEASSTRPTGPASTTLPTDGPTPTGCYADVRSKRVPPELANLSYPDDTIVHNVDIRGDNGILLTGVTDLPFRRALRQMRQRYSDPPFGIVGTEDVEGGIGANWTGPSISGRWVVTDISALCPGDTEVQILWTSAGSPIG